MKERPIIFSGPMVKAILDGSKTVTRRPIKPQPSSTHNLVGYQTDLGYSASRGFYWAMFGSLGSESLIAIKCPYGVPGDELWVRETWRVGAWCGWTRGRHNRRMEISVDYRADNHVRKEWLRVGDTNLFKRLRNQSIDDAKRAGHTTDYKGDYYWKPGEGPTRWRPSIHMPRWASRIQLVVKSVKAERLQKITGRDAIREGVVLLPSSLPFEDLIPSLRETYEKIARKFFRELWNKTYAKRPELQFAANPWVWRVAFEQCNRKENGT